MADLTMKQVRTNAFTDVDTDRERPRYFQHWQHLSITVDDYDIVYGMNFADTELSRGDYDGDDWVPPTKEGFAKYNEIKKQEIGPAKDKSRLLIEGIGSLGRDRVHVLNIEGSNPGSYKQDKLDGYSKTFTEVMVSILSVESEIEPYGQASIWLFQDDLGRLRSGEDNLYVSVYLPLQRMQELVDKIRLSKERPTLNIWVRALLYESDVDASFREIKDPRRYYLPADPGRGMAALGSISFSYDKAKVDLATDAPAEGEEPTVEQPPPAAVASTASPQTLSILRQIKVALWVIAAAIVLHAVLR